MFAERYEGTSNFERLINIHEIEVCYEIVGFFVLDNVNLKLAEKLLEVAGTFKRCHKPPKVAEHNRERSYGSVNENS